MKYLRTLHNRIMTYCYDKNNPQYDNWGGRGIIVCEEWQDKHTFINNIIDTIGHRPNKTYVFDRIDNNGNYELGNVRWADKSISSLNRRNFKNSIVPFKGIRKIKGRFHARTRWRYNSYNLGYYDTAKEANKINAKFQNLLLDNKEKEAFEMLVKKEDVIWNTSKTGVRGITFIDTGLQIKYKVRAGIKTGRYYLGLYENLENAIKARISFTEEAQNYTAKEASNRAKEFRQSKEN